MIVQCLMHIKPTWTHCILLSCLTGANLGLQDANGLSYLEHAMFDRFRSPECVCISGELFTWGPNSNNSLGSQLSRTIPESMDIFHKEYPNENVKQILISQFHSVILTELGRV